MTGKRFIALDEGYDFIIRDSFTHIDLCDVGIIIDVLNELATKCSKLEKENEHLKSEINMLKTTIGRNEVYIERLTHNGDWAHTAKTHLRPKPVK